jgi:hypothetical protein
VINVARAIPSSAEAAQRWQQGFAAAGPKWAAGIESVTVPPGQLAAAQVNRYVTGVTQNAPKWASRVGGVSLSTWKADSIAKGQGRLATGAQVGMAKYQARIGPVLDAIKSIVGGLPARGTVEQNIQRSAQFQMQLHQAFNK